LYVVHQIEGGQKENIEKGVCTHLGMSAGLLVADQRGAFEHETVKQRFT